MQSNALVIPAGQDERHASRRKQGPHLHLALRHRPRNSGCGRSPTSPQLTLVKEGVKSIVVVPTPAPVLGSPQGAAAGAHFFIQDRSGKSIVVEPVDGILKVHDAPLGVMANAPTYDWHMSNLQNYINLSLKYASFRPISFDA
jgi:Linear amide C-N hydrolases, choloylglycine hydrolase family